jgi:hypothetical protein
MNYQPFHGTQCFIKVLKEPSISFDPKSDESNVYHPISISQISVFSPLCLFLKMKYADGIALLPVYRSPY